jgi:hypothetical protein
LSEKKITEKQKYKMPRQRPLPKKLANDKRVENRKKAETKRDPRASHSSTPRMKRNCHRVPHTEYIPLPSSLSTTLPEVEKADNGVWPWPPEISQTFAISIRPERMQALRRRFGPWSCHVTHFPGTNGRNINPNAMKPNIAGKFSRGEIGCYNSHVRLWNQISKENDDKIFLVLEDDAAIFYNKETSQRLRLLFDELKELQNLWDIVYLGHYSDDTAGARVAPFLYEAPLWQGLFACLLTPKAARALSEHAWPMRHQSDKYVGEFISSGKFRALRMDPRLGYVVTAWSDTMKIV